MFSKYDACFIELWGLMNGAIRVGELSEYLLMQIGKISFKCFEL